MVAKDLNDQMANSKGESEQAKYLRSIENRLDKAILKQQEAEHVKALYEKMRDQLQAKALTFHNTLEAREMEIEEANRELKRVKEMLVDAQVGFHCCIWRWFAETINQSESDLIIVIENPSRMQETLRKINLIKMKKFLSRNEDNEKESFKNWDWELRRNAESKLWRDVQLEHHYLEQVQRHQQRHLPTKQSLKYHQLIWKLNWSITKQSIKR